MKFGYKWFAAIGIAFICLACGGEDQDTVVGHGDADASPAAGQMSCFTPDECPQGQYCRSDDPAVTAEGLCTPMEGEGGECVAGGDCSTGLFCLRSSGEIRGLCTLFPETCSDAPTCMCATETCPRLPGSTCSLGSLDNPSETILVVCAD